MNPTTQQTAVLTALNVLSAVAPQVPAIISLVQLAVTLVQENRDPTPEEWDSAIGGIDVAHAQAQAALSAIVAAKAAIPTTAA